MTANRWARTDVLDPLARSLIESTTDGMVVLDGGGSVVSVNPAAERMLGLDVGAMQGVPLAHAFPELASVVSGDTPAMGGRVQEVALCRSGGEVRTADVTIVPVPTDEGRLTLVLIHDVTARKAMEDDLRRRMADLQAVYGLSDAAGRAASVDEIQQRALEAIESAVGADSASILLLDREGVMRFAAWRHVSDAYRRAVEGHSPWPAGTANPQPIVVKTVASSGELGNLAATFAAEGLRSVAFVPLVHDRRLIGKLTFGFREANRLSEADVRLVRALAAQVAWAIERRRAEDALAESEERLRFALGAARVGAWDYDVATGRVTWSAELEDLFGLPRGSFGGTFADFAALLPADDRDAVLAAVRRTLEQGAPLDVEHRIHLPEGRERWVHGAGHVLRDAAGRVVRMSGVTIDVTQRRRTEADHRFLTEASALLFASLDQQTTLAAVARLAVPYLADWCAVDVVEEGGRPRTVAVFHPDPQRLDLAFQLRTAYPIALDAPRGLARVLRTGEPEFFPMLTEEMLLAAAQDDEHLRLMRAVAARSAMVVPLMAGPRVMGAMTFVTSESGRTYTEADLALAQEIARRAGVAVDNARLHRAVSEARARLERQALELQEANRELTQYALVVSHDVKTPLRAVQNYADFLKEDLGPDLPGESAEHLAALGRAVRQAVQFVDDILELSRVGSRPLHAEAVDLRAFLDELILDLHLGQDVVVTWGGDSPWPIRHADPALLRQVFQNLVANAVKFNQSPQKEVALSWQPHDGGAFDVVVRDNGIGIEPRHHERIFGPFQRLHVASEYDGTGIGLAIARKALARLGASLRVASAPGQGSSFIVAFPPAAERQS